MRIKLIPDIGEVPFIWRIELQTKTRHQAHWHIVFFGAQKQAARLVNLWHRLIEKHCIFESIIQQAAFYRIGAKIQDLTGATHSGIIQYLCDHTSKHKRQQLGWNGRQWGVVNRKHLSFEPISERQITEREHIQAARQFRRLQEHLRRDGIYTGSTPAPAGSCQKTMFGKDERRYLAFVDYETSN